jgi:hypothetical protein
MFMTSVFTVVLTIQLRIMELEHGLQMAEQQLQNQAHEIE